MIDKKVYTKIYNSFSTFLTRMERTYNLKREDICEVIVDYIDVNTYLIDDKCKLK